MDVIDEFGGLLYILFPYRYGSLFSIEIQLSEQYYYFCHIIYRSLESLQLLIEECKVYTSLLNSIYYTLCTLIAILQ